VDRADVAEFYDIGKETLVFEGEEQLVELAGRARRDRVWSERIRAAGRRRSLAEHTFAHRVARVDGLWA
jgi:spore maturation protein CgeB